MTSIQIISVGKQKEAEIGVLIADYSKRITAKITETVLPASTAPNAAQRQDKEATAIRQAVLPQHRLILLDERGQNPTSPDLAATMQRWFDDGLNITFVIGGADGLHEDLRRDAHYLLSFGKLTWPHRIVRLMLFEQIYRAQTINSGHPYHRE